MSEQNESNNYDLLFTVMGSVVDAYFKLSEKSSGNNGKYSIVALMNKDNCEKFNSLLGLKHSNWMSDEASNSDYFSNGIRFSIDIHNSDKISIQANQKNISLIKGKFDMSYRDGICIVVNY